MKMFSFSHKHAPEYRIVEGELEGLKFIGFYDFNLLGFNRKKAYPYMLGISLSGFQTDENKMPLTSGRAEIDSFEDRLIELVKATTDCVYTGHSFWHGALEIIFYVREYQHLIEVLEKDSDIKRKLVYTFKIDSDPEWAQLEGLLRPQ